MHRSTMTSINTRQQQKQHLPTNQVTHSWTLLPYPPPRLVLTIRTPYRPWAGRFGLLQDNELLKRSE